MNISPQYCSLYLYSDGISSVNPAAIDALVSVTLEHL